MPKKRPTKPKKTKALATKPASIVVGGNEIAYTIRDPIFGEFHVKASANAWWMNQSKVELLIAALKIDSTWQEARIYAGIAENQLRYFRDRHPEFSLIEKDLRVVPNFKARKVLVEAVDKGDTTTARWYAERKMAGEFGPKPPIVGVQINMQTIVSGDREKYK